MDTLTVNIVGFLASSFSFILWLPQARLTWLNRKNPEKLSGISLGTQYAVVCNALLWGVYAFLAEAWWAGALGIVNLPLALGTIYLVKKASTKSSSFTKAEK